MFQLASVNETNLCLQIQQERGAFVPCQTETVGLSENTVFLVDKSEHVYYKIELFTTGKCLDYNSTTSNLCLSRCDKRELIYWKIDIHTGSVSEGSGENCIYKDYGGSVSVHHCSDGFAKFKFLTVGDHHDHTLKQDDLAERFIEVSSRQLYPKPDTAGYLKGNLEDNLLGIKLFRYYYNKLIF